MATAIKDTARRKMERMLYPVTYAQKPETNPDCLITWGFASE
jgi:hypothetical protein